MTPMPLERAVEVAIEELASWGEPDVAGRPEAAAVLRAWLPFIKAAERYCSDSRAIMLNRQALFSAYRAAKEGK